jgi:hypothetical protein
VHSLRQPHSGARPAEASPLIPSCMKAGQPPKAADLRASPMQPPDKQCARLIGGESIPVRHILKRPVAPAFDVERQQRVLDVVRA